MTKFISSILAVALAAAPFSAYADSDLSELTRGEQIDALKTEIELRKTAMNEVQDAIAAAEAGRIIDKSLVVIGALGAVGVWLVPTISSLEKTVLAGLNIFGAGGVMYSLSLSKQDVASLKERLELTKMHIVRGRRQLSSLLHDRDFSLTKSQQINVLSASIELRKAALADIEARLSKSENIAFSDAAVITGWTLAGVGVWLLPSARLGVIAKQLVSFVAWIYAIGKTTQVVVAKKQVPELKDQLSLAHDYLARDEARLAEISGFTPVQTD